jgi:hypothetical protein
MNPSFSLQRTAHIVRHETGIVIPVYLPEGVDAACGEALLRDTVATYCDQVADPAAICLSVDGEQFGADVAQPLAREAGTSCYVSPANRGKLGAAANGVRVLLAKADLAYVAVVDQDGDHFANELPNFVRAAQHIATHVGHDRIMVLGRRISLHRPLGFLRGELEAFADRVLLDALSYRAAVTNRPLRLEYAMAMDEFPDFHSGYKLFSRTTAREVFLSEPQLAGVSEDGTYRHACEAVMVVEALEHGAYLGVVNRSTFNEQPISTFGQLNLSQLVADHIIWPCKRLDVPLPFVRQWMANHTPRLLLNTLAPHGKEELERIRRLVFAAFGEEQGEVEPVLHPLFV